MPLSPSHHPPPPMFNAQYPPHPQCRQQEYNSTPGWHDDNQQYNAHGGNEMGQYPRPFVEDSRRNNLGSTYQSLPMAHPHSQHMYYPPHSPTLLAMREVQHHGWSRPPHEEWDHHARDYQQFPVVRSSIQMVNEHVPRHEAEKWQAATPTGWTVAHESRPNNKNSTYSSPNTTPSSSLTTIRTGLSQAERTEYTALIKDLWKAARFAQEFKKYSVGDYVRVKELLDRLPDKERPL